MRPAKLVGAGIRAGVVDGVIHVIQWSAEGIGKPFASQLNVNIVVAIAKLVNSLTFVDGRRACHQHESKARGILSRAEAD